MKKTFKNILSIAIAAVMSVSFVTSAFAAETITKKTTFGSAEAKVENYVGTLKGLDITIDGQKVTEVMVVRETPNPQLSVSITGADSLYSNAFSSVYTCKDGKNFVKGDQAAMGTGDSKSTNVVYALNGLVGTKVNYYNDANVSDPAKVKNAPVVADFGYMLIVTAQQEKNLVEKGYLSEFDKYVYPGLANMLVSSKSADTKSSEPSKDEIMKNFTKNVLHLGQ
ncbi:MAG: hypothetical protein IJ736_16495 [Firmicutes bacterium]|nr:hypothetical protein [Bacillota bacterium]